MGSLRHRLVWDQSQGLLADGPRRYLMMRPDALMGALAALDAAAQQSWLQAWAASTQLHGGASLRAYAQAVEFDAEALMAATVQAAADLGWGAWQLTRETSALQLVVSASPFVEGWHAASPHLAPHLAPHPVCAPMQGMLTALALLLWPGAAVDVEESACAAMQPPHVPCCCSFTARVRP